MYKGKQITADVREINNVSFAATKAHGLLVWDDVKKEWSKRPDKEVVGMSKNPER